MEAVGSDCDSVCDSVSDSDTQFQEMLINTQAPGGPRWQVYTGALQPIHLYKVHMGFI